MAQQQEPTLTPSFDLFKPSVNAIKNNLLVYFVLAVLPGLVFSILLIRMGKDIRTDYLGITAAMTLIGLLLYPPLLYTYLHTAQGKQVSLGQVFQESYKRFWPLIGTAFLTGLIIGVGFLLFIVPGIIFLRRYLLAPYYVLDRGLGISEAMAASADESKQYSGSVYGIMGLNILFVLIGIIPILGQIAGTILQILYSVAPALRYLEFNDIFKS
ncbi:MAG: hypothetical protein WAQ57_01125 [Candidatus Saccharimonadales bacterium]